MRLVCVSIAVLALSSAAYSQSSSESASTEHVEGGVPVSQLVAIVAKKTGKKFIVDPRVHANVALVGQDAASVNYDQLLTILSVYDFTVTESQGYEIVVPDANARQTAWRRFTGKETFPDAEFVNATITLKSVSAAQLVPILRPLIPQMGHLAALICTNKLILVDRYANVRRLETIIESLDVGEPYKQEKCEPRSSTSTAGAGDLPAAPRETTVEHR
jgi:type II secretory pathway component GspD/PulD (secretin)